MSERDRLSVSAVRRRQEAGADIGLASPETKRRMGRLIALLMMGVRGSRLAERTGHGQDHDRRIDGDHDPAGRLEHPPMRHADHHDERLTRPAKNVIHSGFTQACLPMDARGCYSRVVTPVIGYSR